MNTRMNVPAIARPEAYVGGATKLSDERGNFSHDTPRMSAEHYRMSKSFFVLTKSPA